MRARLGLAAPPTGFEIRRQTAVAAVIPGLMSAITRGGHVVEPESDRADRAGVRMSIRPRRFIGMSCG